MTQALDYHEFPRPGKLAIAPTKPLTTQHDLALAYSPGVAEACMAIAEDPASASRFTARGNLVAVISNGTAVLGLGNIGPLAAKPVMEGKAVLFKKFADIDVFDIEVCERDPEKLADAIAVLEPTFGAINLEDIKAPECFIVEERLRADEDPGAARRPARHRHRCRRHRAQRAALHRQAHRRNPHRLHGWWGRRHRLPQSAGQHGGAPGEHRPGRSSGRRLCRAQRGHDSCRRRSMRGRPRRARSPRRYPTPISSLGSPPPASLPQTWSGRWRLGQ